MAERPEARGVGPEIDAPRRLPGTQATARRDVRRRRSGVELTEEQVAAARARGCVFFPASPEQVARLSMQRRVFTLGGRPFVATRDGGGFHETHATLARLIAPGAPDPSGGGAGETVPEAEAADAASAQEIAGERGAGGAQEVRRPRAAARPRPPWRGAKGSG
jgi:hypothetical protein